MGDASDLDNLSAWGDVLNELKRLAKEQGPRLLRLVYRELRHHQDAEDVLQTAFLKAVAAIRAGIVRDSSKLQPWLLKVIRTCLIDELRHRIARRRTASGEEAVMDSFPGRLGAPQADYVGLLEILGCIQQFPEEQQEVWYLRELHGYTGTEIARLLDIPLGTVTSRLRLAREKLEPYLRDRIERATLAPKSHERTVGREPQQSGTGAAPHTDAESGTGEQGHEGQ